jgi:anti-sigma factor RsiW
MTDLTGCQHARQSLGVYVLGAIDPAERAEVDAHLAVCPDCREELAGLAGLPALLGHVPASEAARIAGFDNERLAPGQHVQDGDTAGTLTPLLARMAQRRRVQRWRNLAAAAAVVIAAAGAAIGAVSASGPAPPRPSAGAVTRWERVQATDAGTQVHLVVRYSGRSWGTSVDASVTGIPVGTTCKFWVLGSHGQRWQAGGWTVTSPYQSALYPGSSPAPVSAVRGFEVTSGHTVLVHAAA